MKILIIGNSNIFKKKIYFALKKFKNIKLELASRKKIRDINNRESSGNRWRSTNI